MAGNAVSFKGRVTGIEASRVPQVYIVTVEGGKCRLRADIHKEFLVFREGEEVEVTVSRDLPEYREGEDYCGRGHMFSRKDASKGEVRLLISLGGFLNVLEIPRREAVFDVMDEVYLCIKKS